MMTLWNLRQLYDTITQPAAASSGFIGLPEDGRRQCHDKICIMERYGCIVILV